METFDGAALPAPWGANSDSTGKVVTAYNANEVTVTDQASKVKKTYTDALGRLTSVVEDPAVLKIGFGLSADRSQIHAKLGATLQSVLDLDHLFRRRGYNNSLGARAAVGLVLDRNFRKSKSVTTTNWSLPRLSDAQKLYAANDAYAALRVYLALTLTPQERQALLPGR